MFVILLVQVKSENNLKKYVTYSKRRRYCYDHTRKEQKAGHVQRRREDKSGPKYSMQLQQGEEDREDRESCA